MMVAILNDEIKQKLLDIAAQQGCSLEDALELIFQAPPPQRTMGDLLSKVLIPTGYPIHQSAQLRRVLDENA